jgi:hypothetical protein
MNIKGKHETEKTTGDQQILDDDQYRDIWICPSFQFEKKTTSSNSNY